MSGVVGMEDKLLNQVTCRVKQDILKNKDESDAFMLLHHMTDQISSSSSPIYCKQRGE